MSAAGPSETMATDPICGMSVEETPDALRLTQDNRTYYFCCGECLSAFAAPEEARRRVLRRLAVAWPASLAILLLTWAVRFPLAPDVAGVLATVVQVYAGWGFYLGARDALRRRIGNMDLLIACGTTAAYGYSVAVLLTGTRLPPATYFDASSLIVTVILTGNYLEQLTRRRAGSALRALQDLLPATVHLVETSGDRVLPLSGLRGGQRVRVAPGTRFPADGWVREGESSVDEAILTGESSATRKVPGAQVLAGSMNLDGPIVVEVTAAGPDTFLAHVGELLTGAEMAKVPLQRQADRIAAWFVPIVLLLGLGSAAAWLFVGGAGPSVSLLVFVTVAVTACPCAFGLATPAAILVGTGVAAEEGVLFRGPEAIERASTIDTVLTDKTGTLTTAEAEVDRVYAVPPASEGEVLRLAAGLERGIDHPLARALGAAARSRGQEPTRFDRVSLLAGRGLEGFVEGQRYALARSDATAPTAVGLPGFSDWAREVEAEGRPWSLLLKDGTPCGAIAFRAGLVDGAKEAVRELRQTGVRVVLVTGDNLAAAGAVATALGISEVHAGVRPEGKVELVRASQSAGRRVAFVGDGVNDAPALAAADLGIAIGTGAEVARETGQVLLVRPDLRGVPRTLWLGRRMVGRVRANLVWALGYNLVLLPIAAGALVPLLGLGVYRFLPVLGAVAMGLSSTTVLVSSLSLRWRDAGGRPTVSRGTTYQASAPAQAV